MNRRYLLKASVGLIPVMGMPNVALTQVSTPTPATSLPELPSDISPMPITEELELLYFRSVVLGSGVQLVGELRNTADYWVASPLLILRSATGLKAQPHMLHGDIPPGGREQFSRGFFDEPMGKDRADALELSIDTVELEFYDIGGSLGIYNDQMDLHVETNDLALDLDRPGFRATVQVTNLADFPTHYVYASALFFDEAGYYCGDLTSLQNARIKSDDQIELEIEEGFDSFSTAGNPLELINEDPVVVVQAGWVTVGSPICI